MSFFLHEQHYRDLAFAQGQQITVCGCGALGANLAESLARMGFCNLVLIDRDRIEQHNLSTQPWTQQDIGAPKTRVLANLLYRAVAARCHAHQLELTPVNAANLLEGSALVIDAFDNLEGRRAVAEAASAANIPCLHIALSGSGDYGCGLWDERFTLRSSASQQDSCDYPLTRPLALLVANAAAETVAHFFATGERRSFELTLRDMRLNPLAQLV